MYIFSDLKIFGDVSLPSSSRPSACIVLNGKLLGIPLSYLGLVEVKSVNGVAKIPPFAKVVLAVDDDGSPVSYRRSPLRAEIRSKTMDFTVLMDNKKTALGAAHIISFSSLVLSALAFGLYFYL